MEERKNSQAKIDANNRYTKANYTQLNFRVKKGEETKIKDFAKAQGMSLNGFINKLIYQAMGEEQPNSDND